MLIRNDPDVRKKLQKCGEISTISKKIWTKSQEKVNHNTLIRVKLQINLHFLYYNMYKYLQAQLSTYIYTHLL